MSDAKTTPGILYVVATPIGNLEDMSPRATQTLTHASLVAAEDTRTARRLLTRFDIRTPLTSYHEHNETRRVPQLVRRLLAGDDVAIVSDAGTPAISDPGFRIVRAALEAGIRVVPIPGPCAAIAALSAAGLPTDRFLFLGFLPPRKGRRRTLLESVRAEPGTLIMHESPHRILETLQDIDQVLPGRDLVLARELTKVHEEFLRGSPRWISEQLSTDGGRRLKGEMTLLIAGAGHRTQPSAPECPPPDTGMKALARHVATSINAPTREVYQALQRLKDTRGRGQHALKQGKDPTSSA